MHFNIRNLFLSSIWNRGCASNRSWDLLAKSLNGNWTRRVRMGAKLIWPTQSDWKKRPTMMCHNQLYQKRVKREFDKKVRPQEFRLGDLVLKKIISLQKYSCKKWIPNYEGLYMVKKAFLGGALVLRTWMEKSWHIPSTLAQLKIIMPNKKRWIINLAK